MFLKRRLTFVFKTQVFVGNTDTDTVVTAMFPRRVRATFIRIKPTKWHEHRSIRFELLGCEGML